MCKWRGALSHQVWGYRQIFSIIVVREILSELWCRRWSRGLPANRFLMELSDAANRSAARVLSSAQTQTPRAQHCDQMGGSVCHLVRGVPCNHHHRAPRAPKIIINPRSIWAILLNVCGGETYISTYKHEE